MDRTRGHHRKAKFLLNGGSILKRRNLKELTEGHHQVWSLRLNLTQHGETHPTRTPLGLTDRRSFLDYLVGGAWPFLVGGVICLVYSDNERDSGLLTSTTDPLCRPNVTS